MIDTIEIAEVPEVEAPTIYACPQGKKQWSWLRYTAKRAELVQCGLRPFLRTATGHVWLFPAHWYDALPYGLRITLADGKDARFDKHKHSNAATMGLLTFGIHRWSKHTNATP